MVTDEVAEGVDDQRILLARTWYKLRWLTDMWVIAEDSINTAGNNFMRGFNNIDVGIHLELPSPVTVSDDPLCPLRFRCCYLLLDQ